MKNLPIKSEAFIYVEKSFKEWLDILGYAPSTVYQMPNYVRELFYYLETQKQLTQINQITTPLIKEHYNNLRNRSNSRKGGGLSNNYLNKQLQAFYKLQEYLRQTGKMTLPHLEIGREEKEAKPTEVLTITEIKMLYEASEQITTPTGKWEVLKARDKAMLSIFYSCGLRRNEGSNLDLGDINFDRQILHVKHGKNYKERFVPFNKTNAELLQTYVYDYRYCLKKSTTDDALFLSMRGTRMKGQSLSLRLKLLQQKTDDIELQQKDISLHTLRHSIATHLLAAGMNLEKISQFLGHSSLESTQIYTHLAGQNQ